MVAALYVRALVHKRKVERFALHIGGNVYPRAEYSENERAFDAAAAPDVFLNRHGFPHPAL